MTDGPTVEPPPGRPSSRALGAMESAVRRAREATGAATPPSVPPAPAPRPPEAEEPSPAGATSARQPDRWLATTIVVVAGLVVAGAIALAFSLGTNGNGPQTASPPTTAAAGATHAGTAPTGHPSTASGSPSGSGTTSTPSSTSSTTTTTIVPATPGAAPVISSLSPPSGTAGTAIQVTGANFLSSDGHIVATFNGQVAPTSCADQSTCTITVPPSTGSSSAQVTITTASGTSNAITFTYG